MCSRTRQPQQLVHVLQHGPGGPGQHRANGQVAELARGSTRFELVQQPSLWQWNNKQVSRCAEWVWWKECMQNCVSCVEVLRQCQLHLQ